MNEYNFPVIIEYDAEEDVYLADCPVLPGVDGGLAWAMPAMNASNRPAS